MKSRSRVQLQSNEGEVTDSGANYVKKHHVLEEEERGTMGSEREVERLTQSITKLLIEFLASERSNGQSCRN